MRVYALMLAALVLTACAAPEKRDSGTREHFHTRITDNGSKQFLLKIEIPYRKPRPSAITQQSAARGPVEELNQRTKAIAARTGKRLDAILEQTGFCRNGWFLLEKTAYGGQGYIPGQSSIRGECEETATAADRRRFPNTGPLPD